MIFKINISTSEETRNTDRDYANQDSTDMRNLLSVVDYYALL